jgi:hypothetical protein
VAITSLKPPSGLTSGLPRIFSSGTRQSSKISAVVSETLMPSLFSTLTTVMPGVWCSTTNGLIPARPALLSTVAQTTTKPSDNSTAILPLVQKILVPLITQWSPSRRAVVVMAALSEPHPGSVIAIAAHLGLPSLKRFKNRFFCSGVPAAITAAPPNPGFGICRNSPTSPHASSSAAKIV